jgi:predicted nucleotidyltransferase
MTVQPFNKFNENTAIFLKNLEQVTNHKIYFFGSSRRFDYIDGCDIDIAMFTDNIPSLISKIIAFLNIKNDFKEIINIQKNMLINGYKLNYINEDINIELVIYDTKFKNIMIDFYEKSSNLPFIISIILLCLKYLNIYGLLDRKMYYKIKIFLFNNFYYSSKLVVIN